MIAKALRLLTKLLKVFMPFVSAFIGIKLFYTYNIFEKFISDFNIANDVGISVYFATSEILLNTISGCLEKKIKKQDIKVIFYNPGDNPYIGNTPTLRIRGENPSKIQVDISVSAFKNKSKKMAIIFRAAPFYTMQLTKPNNVVEIDYSGNLIVKISDMFNEQNEINTKISIDLLFIKNQDVQIEADLCCELNKNRIFTEFASNKAIIEIR